MIRFRLPLLVLALVLLAGCGFHLRSKIALPADLGPVRVVGASTSYSALVTSLSAGLSAGGPSVGRVSEIVTKLVTTGKDRLC